MGLSASKVHKERRVNIVLPQKEVSDVLKAHFNASLGISLIGLVRGNFIFSCPDETSMSFCRKRSHLKKHNRVRSYLIENFKENQKCHLCLQTFLYF